MGAEAQRRRTPARSAKGPNQGAPAARPASHSRPHPPQGAPTSPALASQCAYGLDVRLTAAAHAAGATYRRYADDLLFAGDPDFARRVSRFATLVAAIAQDEGLVVNHRKTRVMPHGGRQLVGGLVVNERPRAEREDYDHVKTILHHCERHGAASQNHEGRADFRAFVRGLVSSSATQVNPKNIR
jgi:RNA-directed DNA polymerase